MLDETSIGQNNDESVIRLIICGSHDNVRQLNIAGYSPQFGNIRGVGIQLGWGAGQFSDKLI